MLLFITTAFVVTNVYPKQNYPLENGISVSIHPMMTFNSTDNISVGSGPHNMAYDSDNGYLYVINYLSSNVSVINKTNRVIANIDVGSSPIGITFDPLNGYLYVVNYVSNSVSVINKTNQVTATYSVGSYPMGDAFDPLNGCVYVANSDSGTVSVINTSTSVISTVSVGNSPTGVAYNTLNGYIYVTDRGSNDVSVINKTNQVVDTVAVGSVPCAIGFDSTNGYMYVANSQSNSVSVINKTNILIDTISVGANPCGVGFDSANDYVYIANDQSADVSVINNTNNVIGTINVGNRPMGIAYDPSTGYVYVANFISDNLSAIAQEYNITFAETGLNTGTPWYVNLTNGMKSGQILTPTYSFSLVNGTYSYTLSTSDKNFSQLVQSSSFGVNNSAKSIPVKFVKAYIVTFKESGLPSTSTWYVNITGENSSGQISAGSSFTTHLANGTYYYTIGTPDKIYAASSSKFAVNGATLPVNISFSNVKYKVTFTESGLPSTSTWYVNITGENSSGQISAGSSFTINLTNGTYYYTIGTPLKNLSASSSKFTINGASLSESVTFSEVKYQVTFKESGLAISTGWYVNITGQLPSGPITYSSYSMSITNGTYNFTITTSDKIYKVSFANTSFRVNGSSVSEAITFSEVTYKVTFSEAGLISGTSWSVTLNNLSRSSTNSTITFTETNGSYEYTVRSIENYILSLPSGNANVDGNNVTISTTFSPTKTTPSKYTITFTESGLPSGTSWAITFNGSTQSSSTNTISFTIQNGTYTFTVGAISGYKTSSSGSIVVNGANIKETIFFNTTSNSSSNSTSGGLSSVEIYAVVGSIITIAGIGSVLVYTFRFKK